MVVEKKAEIEMVPCRSCCVGRVKGRDQISAFRLGKQNSVTPPIRAEGDYSMKNKKSVPSQSNFLLIIFIYIYSMAGGYGSNSIPSDTLEAFKLVCNRAIDWMTSARLTIFRLPAYHGTGI
jgi:hypothetical protein